MNLNCESSNLKCIAAHIYYFSKSRSSHQRCSRKKAVLKIFALFTGKHLCWSLFLTKLQVFAAKITYFEITYFEEHLRAAASVNCY